MLQGLGIDATLKRGLNGVRITFQECHNFVLWREAVRIAGGIDMARKFDRPIWELKYKGVPAFGAPTFRDARPFKNYMFDSRCFR